MRTPRKYLKHGFAVLRSRSLPLCGLCDLVGSERVSPATGRRVWGGFLFGLSSATLMTCCRVQKIANLIWALRSRSADIRKRDRRKSNLASVAFHWSSPSCCTSPQQAIGNARMHHRCKADSPHKLVPETRDSFARSTGRGWYCVILDSFIWRCEAPARPSPLAADERP